MNELDIYHARAALNDRNPEGILSIIAFNILGGKNYSTIKLTNMIKAIAKTIELTCTVKHDGSFNKDQKEGNKIYRTFWKKLFDGYDKNKSFPALITLNYDLVLERSLLQSLVGSDYKQHSFDGIILKYFYPRINDFIYVVSNLLH